MRRIIGFMLALVVVLANVAVVSADGPGPGNGNSRNFQCTGNPADRPNGCK